MNYLDHFSNINKNHIPHPTCNGSTRNQEKKCASELKKENNK